MGVSSNLEPADRRRFLGWLLALGTAVVPVLGASPVFGKDGGSDGGGHGGSDGGSHGGSDGDDHGGSDGHGRDGGDDDDRGGKQGDDDGAENHAVERFMERIKARGVVDSASVAGDGIAVRYVDGWSESISGGRYRLMDAGRRIVKERAARRSDYRRLTAAASASR